MGRPVRSLKRLAEHEAHLRRLCRTLARELRAATAPVDPAVLARIAVRLEAAGEPIALPKPPAPTKKPHAA